MSTSTPAEDRTRALAPAQQIGLIVLRSLVGWHVLYEGYYKALLPGWDAAGHPLPGWTSAGYLAAAGGPLAPLFHWLAAPSRVELIDAVVIAALIGAGLSLLLGLFTQAGAWTALALLSLFYLAQIPLAGRPVPGTEGAALLVNKTLIEWGAVLTVLLFRTGEIAGLDLLRAPAPNAARRSTADARLPETSHGAHA